MRVSLSMHAAFLETEISGNHAAPCVLNHDCFLLVEKAVGHKAIHALRPTLEAGRAAMLLKWCVERRSHFYGADWTAQRAAASNKQKLSPST
jgi:hypothetical protein